MKICFLSLGSSSLLAGKDHEYIGGAEVEQTCLANELVALGYDISFVTYRHGNGISQIENRDKMEIIQTYERDKAIEISTLIKYKSIWSALKKSNAEIYFHESGSTGLLPLFSYLKRKKFVYRIPSDAMVLSRPLSGKYTFQEKIINTIEIKRADIVIAQSEFQKRILKERFKKNSIIIKNGLIIPKVTCEINNDPIILWVASIRSIKRPHLFIELAKSIPNAHFEMVGGKVIGETLLYEKIRMAAKKLPNLRFHGFVPYYNVNEYFNRASIFVNTSIIEGFPNTFIQAWMHYTPIVSLNVDPDKIIQNKKLGFFSGTFEQMVLDLKILLEDETLRKAIGKNARKYVEKEHNIKKTVKKYIEVFNEIL